MGAMTGGARELCTPRGHFLGRGGSYVSSSWGRRHSRVNRNRFYATGRPGWRRTGFENSGFGLPASAYDRDGEMASLKSQASALKDELAEIESRLRDLESQY